MSYMTVRRRRTLGRLGDSCTVNASGTRVCTAAPPAVPAWQVPNVGSQSGWTDEQKLSMGARMNTALSGVSFLNRNISLWNPPADSLPFIVSDAVEYPAPAANPAVVISYTVPQGQMAVINKLAVVHVGGNPPDFSGNVIWSVLINGAGIDGLGAIESQVGTLANPNDFVFVAIENDIVQVIVEVVTNPMPVGQTTAALFHGWTYPLVQATNRAGSGVLQ
jgi:hypothetical protein